MKKINLKDIFFIVLILILGILILQKEVVFYKEKGLSGAIKKIENPNFTIKEWLNQSFQQKKDKYINDNFGFRNTLVRIYNQISFDIFKIPRARQIIIGKQNYLFELNYIKAYYGYDYIGEDKIKEKVRKIKKLQDTLKQKDIDLIVIFAAGKGTFYPEYIPNKFHREITKTNYSDYIKWSDSSKINYIDFNEYFMRLKDTSTYTLFPRTGIHWSQYANYFVSDSIFKYIAEKRNLPKLGYSLNKIKTSNKTYFADQDIEDGLNLLFDIPDLVMAYPEVSLIKNNDYKPKVLAIADSYYWNLSKYYTSNVFGNERFWFYYQSENPHTRKWDEKIKKVDKTKIKEEIEKSEVIILLATDANLFKFPFGFVEEAYKLYCE